MMMERAIATHETCETIGQIYDTSTMTYVSPQSTSPPVIGGIIYPEYANSEWHQVDPNRQSEVVQYQPYMGYHPSSAINQPELITNGTYWQGEFNGHATLPNYTYHSNERLHSPSDYSNDSNQGSPTGKSGKAKRRRVQTHSQRKAANIRERRRMFHLNEAFDELRKRLPAFNYEKRLSRIETLRLAMTYISFMKDISDGNDPDDVKLLKYQTAMDETLFRSMQEQINDTDESHSPL